MTRLGSCGCWSMTASFAPREARANKEGRRRGTRSHAIRPAASGEVAPSHACNANAVLWPGPCRRRPCKCSLVAWPMPPVPMLLPHFLHLPLLRGRSPRSISPCSPPPSSCVKECYDTLLILL
jgi:hypothetical protein